MAQFMAFPPAESEVAVAVAAADFAEPRGVVVVVVAAAANAKMIAATATRADMWRD